MTKISRSKEKSFRPNNKKSASTNPKIDKPADDSYRLNKYIAHCGICSRRDAADLVKSGKILVNGTVLDNPAYIVQKKDVISYNGKPVKPEENKIYLLLNKPKNVVTTLSDEQNRRTIMDIIKDDISERIYPVGRLDRNSTGLLLMTNDGDLAQKLSHPSRQVKKLYHVGLDKNLSKNDFEKIMSGLTLEDGPIRVDGMEYVDGKKDEVGIEIHSGKNRIIRRIFEHVGYEVKKLDRVYFAGLTKKYLPRGRYRMLSNQEIIMLKHFT